MTDTMNPLKPSAGRVAGPGARTVFLCGPGGAAITGTAHPVDSGWTAQ